MRNNRNVVFVLDGTCNRNCTWAATHTLAGKQAVVQLLIDKLAVVRGDIYKSRVKFLQGIDGAEECCSTISLQWRKNLK